MMFNRAAAFLLLIPIRAYQFALRPLLVGGVCRHVPTCSEYAAEAITRHGPWRGFRLAMGRIARCRPGGTKGFDPVP